MAVGFVLSDKRRQTLKSKPEREIFLTGSGARFTKVVSPIGRRPGDSGSKFLLILPKYLKRFACEIEANLLARVLGAV